MRSEFQFAAGLEGMTRREALRRGLLGTAGLALAGSGLPLLGAPRPQPVSAPVAKAKSVIQIWCWGGPAHLDTFDPKPDAGPDYVGAFTKPIPTNVDGIQICELLPLLAKQADK